MHETRSLFGWKAGRCLGGKHYAVESDLAGDSGAGTSVRSDEAVAVEVEGTALLHCDRLRERQSRRRCLLASGGTAL